MRQISEIPTMQKNKKKEMRKQDKVGKYNLARERLVKEGSVYLLNVATKFTLRFLVGNAKTKYKQGQVQTCPC